MRRLLPVLVVAVVALGGCAHRPAARFHDRGATEAGGVERFTQGGASMEPAVKPGQVISARKVGREYAPRRGDIVVFHGDGGPWGDATKVLLKRVIAVGGETVACCDAVGRVTVDDQPLDEPYVVNNGPLDRPSGTGSCLPRRFGPVAVPAGTVFVMGDNRIASNDSRCLGPIPAASIFAVMIS